MKVCAACDNSVLLGTGIRNGTHCRLMSDALEERPRPVVMDKMDLAAPHLKEAQRRFCLDLF